MTYTRKKVQPGEGHRCGRDLVGQVFVDPPRMIDYVCTRWYDETENIYSAIELEPQMPGYAFKTAVTRDGQVKCHMLLPIGGTLDDLEAWDWKPMPSEVTR